VLVGKPALTHDVRHLSGATDSTLNRVPTAGEGQKSVYPLLDQKLKRRVLDLL
jgi:hypothetical protein